ncbi:40S ribosomal protein S4 [Heterostelium album PN500]|uniref:40S ribosomal protein S4 n=1 Tax=Heterostelium pallidum (strain ATCC 26659 / Pp 5 / PN500) TaxID=670386 RepID=D3BCZ8_HETP5|nr:40S ribosomal protein S4 [Heterostelium album PN500]EFA80790.1 40S ribosomal protein S4 [Heterostelium album PN500]|eukprot:XP_020432909.1 40S ribosomal protein S4 [Heterostelium album PN500]
MNFQFFVFLKFFALSLTTETHPPTASNHILKTLFSPFRSSYQKMAPRPSPGPRKLKECLPLCIILRNRLKYALTRNEVTKIVMQRLVKINGVVRTDVNFPVGFMDVVSIEKTNENFRLLFDTKGRFQLQRIQPNEAKFILTKVTKVETGLQGIPYLHTDNGHTYRYPDPAIKIHDTVKIDLETSKIVSFVPFELNNLCMITGGHNLGRVGVITNRERHLGSFDIVHVTDSVGHSFATRLSNVFIIGKGSTTFVSLLAGKGVKKSLIDERNAALKKKGEKIEVVA